MGEKLVHFYLGYLKFHQSQQSQAVVHVLSPAFCANLMTRHPTAANVKLLRQGGPEVVVLPVLSAGTHWFIMVAVMLPKPTIIVIDSYNGGNSRPPSVVWKFRDFLGREQQLLGVDGVVFDVITPAVLPQPNSCDSSFFSIKYVMKIIEDPYNLVERAQAGQLRTWFPLADVGSMREELGTLVSHLGQDQREESQPLYGVKLDIPEIDFSKVIGRS